MSENATCLSEEELQELEAFFGSDAAASCMDPEMLDGFLTALAIGPKRVPPEEWLPWVWHEDGEPGWEPEFGSPARRERIIGLLRRHADSVVPRLDAHAFTPLLYSGEGEDAWRDFATPWCEGFLTGVGLRVEAWDALTRDPEAGELLAPMVALTGPEEDGDLAEMVDDRDMRDELVQSLPESVAGIHRYWQTRRSAPREPGRPQGRAPRGGRPGGGRRR